MALDYAGATPRLESLRGRANFGPARFAAGSIRHPGAGGGFTLYDDDSRSLGNRDGSDPKTVWLRCRWDDAARRLTLEPDPLMKKWPGGVRVFSVEMAGSDAKPKRVEFRGEKVLVDL